MLGGGAGGGGGGLDLSFMGDLMGEMLGGGAGGAGAVLRAVQGGSAGVLPQWCCCLLPAWSAACTQRGVPAPCYALGLLGGCRTGMQACWWQEGGGSWQLPALPSALTRLTPPTWAGDCHAGASRQGPRARGMDALLGGGGGAGRPAEAPADLDAALSVLPPEEAARWKETLEADAERQAHMAAPGREGPTGGAGFSDAYSALRMAGRSRSAGSGLLGMLGGAGAEEGEGEE